MAQKKVRVHLVPMQGTLTHLSAKVDGVVIFATNGSKAEATVRASRTDVQIDARGTPSASFLCEIEAIYDDGRRQTICAQSQFVGASGTYSEVFHIVALPPPPTAVSS